MYKTATLREINARNQSAANKGNAGIGRMGAGNQGKTRMEKKLLIQTGIHNARWNVRGKLPKGANRKRNGPIGSQRTGR